MGFNSGFKGLKKKEKNAVFGAYVFAEAWVSRNTDQIYRRSLGILCCRTMKI